MRNSEPMIWTCKDGRKLKVVDMTDDHLLNTIKFLWRNRELYRLREARGLDFLASDSDHVQMALDGAAEELATQDDMEFMVEYAPQYYMMLAEAFRRYLTLPDEIVEALFKFAENEHLHPFRLCVLGKKLQAMCQMDAVHLAGCALCNHVYEGYANDSHAVPASLQGNNQPGSDAPQFVNSKREGGSGSDS